MVEYPGASIYPEDFPIFAYADAVYCEKVLKFPHEVGATVTYYYPVAENVSAPVVGEEDREEEICLASGKWCFTVCPIKNPKGSVWYCSIQKGFWIALIILAVLVCMMCGTSYTKYCKRRKILEGTAKVAVHDENGQEIMKDIKFTIYTEGRKQSMESLDSNASTPGVSAETTEAGDSQTDEEVQVDVNTRYDGKIVVVWDIPEELIQEHIKGANRASEQNDSEEDEKGEDAGNRGGEEGRNLFAIEPYGESTRQEADDPTGETEANQPLLDQLPLEELIPAVIEWERKHEKDRWADPNFEPTSDHFLLRDGDCVEYFSQSCGHWLPGKVHVEPNPPLKPQLPRYNVLIDRGQLKESVPEDLVRCRFDEGDDVEVYARKSSHTEELGAIAYADVMNHKLVEKRPGQLQLQDKAVIEGEVNCLYTGDVAGCFQQKSRDVYNSVDMMWQGADHLKHFESQENRSKRALQELVEDILYHKEVSMDAWPNSVFVMDSKNNRIADWSNFEANEDNRERFPLVIQGKRFDDESGFWIPGVIVDSQPRNPTLEGYRVRLLNRPQGGIIEGVPSLRLRRRFPRDMLDLQVYKGFNIGWIRCKIDYSKADKNGMGYEVAEPAKRGETIVDVNRLFEENRTKSYKEAQPLAPWVNVPIVWPLEFDLDDNQQTREYVPSYFLRKFPAKMDL
jgi:hypothetical protein